VTLTKLAAKPRAVAASLLIVAASLPLVVAIVVAVVVVVAVAAGLAASSPFSHAENHMDDCKTSRHAASGWLFSGK
jgi:hypothetical protein